MGVFIKGMKMPKAGAYSCELGVLDKNTAVLTIYTPIDEPQRSFNLVPVQTPHGRLIDENDFFSDDIVYPDKQFEKGMRDFVSDMPTIIEAEVEV